VLKYMTGRIPPLSGVEVCKALQRDGFKNAGGKGSHRKLKKVDNEVRVVIVPLHDEIAPKTLNSILKQAKITRERFLELLK